MEDSRAFDTCPGRRRHRHRRHHRDHDAARAARALADELRALADDLRAPVAELVRGIVDEVADAARRASTELGDLLDDALDEVRGAHERVRRDARRRGRAEAAAAREDRGAVDAEGDAADAVRARFGHVLGWQPIFLERSATCAACDAPLLRGERAFLGIAPSGFTGDTLCAECVRG
ncbi:MAG: hypothetical protein R3E88_01185 [Myxococcota bacterium]